MHVLLYFAKLRAACECRMGRAMLIPIFRGHYNDDLELALKWWLEVLLNDIYEIRYVWRLSYRIIWYAS